MRDPIVKEMAGEVFTAIAEYIERQMKPLKDRIAELESSHLRYVGVFEGGKYIKGEVVTHRGSMWVCRTTTEGKPGETDDWQLAVKAGRDGRDR